MVFSSFTSMVADIVGFTPMSERLSPEEMLERLNYIFSDFDELAEIHGLEKIKTIGDAYMAVSGLPHEHPDHALNAARCAMEMQDYISERNKTASVKWNMRLGMHSGSVIAGVVGKNKFTYDLWGNTVNLASRMETAGVEDKVNVSAATYELIREEFDGEYRGKIEVDGKGDVDMYLIHPKKASNEAASQKNGSKFQLDIENPDTEAEAQDGEEARPE
jgi:class 3 adenylate cyclase